MCMQGGLAPLLCTLQCKDLIKALPRYQEIDSAVQGLQVLDMTSTCSDASFPSSHEPLANICSQLLGFEHEALKVTATLASMYWCVCMGYLRSNQCRLACLQAVPLTATITYTDPNSAYMALQQALSAHSPAIVPPVAKPLVLVGPYGPACSKSALLERLLKKHGDVFVCPQHITTQAQPAAVADGTEAASLALKVCFSQHGSRNCHFDAA